MTCSGFVAAFTGVRVHLNSAGLDGLVRRWKPTPDPDSDQIDGDVALYPSTAGVSPDGRSFFTYSRSKCGDRRWELIH